MSHVARGREAARFFLCVFFLQKGGDLVRCNGREKDRLGRVPTDRREEQDARVARDFNVARKSYLHKFVSGEKEKKRGDCVAMRVLASPSHPPVAC